MTQEEKQHLLKVLCEGLPYGLKYNFGGNDGCDYTMNRISLTAIDDAFPIEDIKPYLRPISSVTREEWLKLKEWIFVSSDTEGKIYFDGFRNISAKDTVKAMDYLISHHFDYRGLIEKRLALEAPEGMYNTK